MVDSNRQFVELALQKHARSQLLYILLLKEESMVAVQVDHVLRVFFVEQFHFALLRLANQNGFVEFFEVFQCQPVELLVVADKRFERPLGGGERKRHVDEPVAYASGFGAYGVGLESVER